MITCGYMVYDLYAVIINNPIAVVRDDQPRGTMELDFPGITIIPDVFYPMFEKYEEKFYEYLGDEDFYDYFDELIEKNNDTMNVITEGILCQSGFTVRVFNYSNYSEDMVAIARNFSQKSWFTQQTGSFFRKYNLKFAEVFLRNGNAFTFNTKNFEEIYNEDVVSDHLNFTYDVFLANAVKLKNITGKFPCSPPDASDDGVLLTIKQFKSESPLCVRGGVVVHSPNEIAVNLVQTDIKGFVFGSFQEILIDVDVTYADDSIRSVDISRRKCFFEDERPLRFFKHYSYKNCQTECWYNQSLSEHDCVPFFLVRDKTSRVCEIKDYGYVFQAEHSSRLNAGNEFVKICNCYPDCNQVEYKLEVVQGKFFDQVM